MFMGMALVTSLVPWGSARQTMQCHASPKLGMQSSPNEPESGDRSEGYLINLINICLFVGVREVVKGLPGGRRIHSVRVSAQTEPWGPDSCTGMTTCKYIPSQDCSNECYAFLALVDVIELIVASLRTSVQPEKLLAAVEKFLQLFRDAWGCGWMTPKFHWLLHFYDHVMNYEFRIMKSEFRLDKCAL